MGKTIDEMGKASAVAQELKTPVTSADKLVNSDHIVYLMTEHDKPGYVFQIHLKFKMFYKLLRLISVNIFIQAFYCCRNFEDGMEKVISL